MSEHCKNIIFTFCHNQLDATPNTYDQIEAINLSIVPLAEIKIKSCALHNISVGISLFWYLSSPLSSMASPINHQVFWMIRSVKDALCSAEFRDHIRCYLDTVTRGKPLMEELGCDWEWEHTDELQQHSCWCVGGLSFSCLRISISDGVC
jgi:hypothetical protein